MAAALRKNHAGAAADHGEEPDHGNDQLELALFGGYGLGAFSRGAAFPFILSHRPSTPEERTRSHQPLRDTNAAGAHAPLISMVTLG